ncbi:hypothetical protein EPN42_15400 [bacterium]|nr:MAG: hypothetical protein EPN42_15400 [bacterium]
MSGWCSSSFDALETQAAQTSGAAGAPSLARADAIVADAAPMLPLGRFQLAIASNPATTVVIDEHAPLFAHVEHWRA